ncbi:TlpA family protein disulfide reductase [Mesonia sediminis]|uniref:TlpA family protein disulfide reductase n=1 Tax=Mesonia sediminis TaxID=1703946 RepID=A0ABW5SGM2_9FLAO
MRILLIFVAVMMAHFSQAQSQMPNVQLKNMDNQLKNVYKDYAEDDKVYIFSFWATWCAPCINELEAIKAVYTDWQEEVDVELIAISIDDARTVKRVKPMVNGKAWEYEILLDTNQELKRKLQINNVPHTIVVKNQKVMHVSNGYAEGAEEELFEEIKAL